MLSRFDFMRFAALERGGRGMWARRLGSMTEVCAQRESVNIVFRCVARVAKISCGASDMFDRLIGVCYGDFGYRFSLPGGRKRFRYCHCLFTQGN
jgi:hypothetical protein